MALVDAKSNLTTAQQRMKRAVDKKRRTEEYKIGDEVVPLNRKSADILSLFAA